MWQPLWTHYGASGRGLNLAIGLPLTLEKGTPEFAAMAESKITTDHDEIRTWAEERGGRPAVVRSTHGKGGTGILRLEFPNAPNSDDNQLEEISWEEFFKKFDDAGLALLHQEKTADGKKSNFNKLIARDTAEAREHGAAHASRHHPRGR
jgi:hypothetical protein